MGCEDDEYFGWGGFFIFTSFFLGKFHWDVWKILSTMEINYVKSIEISPFSLARCFAFFFSQVVWEDWTLLVFPGWAEGNQSPGLQDLHLRSGLQSERSSVQGATSVVSSR